MSSEQRLPLRVESGRIVPVFLGDVDVPWLRVLLEERQRFTGRKMRELEVRLREPLPCLAPPAKLHLAVRTLRKLCGGRVDSPLQPRAARKLVFAEAVRGAGRDRAMEAAAGQLATTPSEVEASLFADLPGERIVEPLDPSITPQQLAARANLTLVRCLLAGSSRITIELTGASRAVVRQAKLRGLITLVQGRGDDGVRLDVSGPYALFRHTLLYGRAIGELLPLLAWCSRFSLEAECVSRSGSGRLRLVSGDPIFPAAEPRRFDSRLEERFAREFQRLAPDWDVIREPEPVACGPSLLFPDFLLRHRADPGRNWLVEIVGFWTPRYLEHKLARLRDANLGNLIVCIDANRNCADADLPAASAVVRFRGRIRAEDVLAHLEARRGRPEG